MFEVPYGQDPYNAIGKYIRDHINIIEDVIAVIEIDGVETNQLFMVDMDEDGYFIWNSDWYEGEEKVVLMDFFPVSEAINSSVQPEQSIEIQDILEYLDTVLHPIVSPDHWNVYSELHDMISMLPPAQQEQKWTPCSDPSDLPKDERLWITRDIYGARIVYDVIWDMTEWSDSVSGVVAYMPYWEPEPYTERRE